MSEPVALVIINGRPEVLVSPATWRTAALVLTGDSARLLTAVPDAGYAAQRWSGPGWLRIDFTSGARVSSLIASWNGHPPSVVTTN